MPSILPGYTYDIFISYRQKDNKGERWVTEFVKALKEELDSTFKEDISIYFDENPADGLLETHHVDKSLESKLRSLIFIPILSQTYCDPKSFAWQQEFCVFNKLAKRDAMGREVRLTNGNVGSRILPVKIHDLEQADKSLVESELGDVLRPIEFTFKSPGVNRPLRFAEDSPQSNLNKFFYRDQINKVANAIKAIVEGARMAAPLETKANDSQSAQAEVKFAEQIKEKDLGKVALVYVIVALVSWKAADIGFNLLAFPKTWSNSFAIFLATLFPVAMFLAWKFEKSPTGFVRSGSPAAFNNPLSRKEKRPLTSSRAILSLVAVMLVLYFIPQNFLPGMTAISAPASENKSIAVLYFDNMSGEESQDYLSDGLTEEIITRLTKIPGLRVISRTSVGVYKGQPLNLKKIASDLNVAVVLEGSVRKAGNQLRVTAQLINAETDEHLWAESYDREMTDVFEVQKEIAQVIADKFKIVTSPEVNIRVNEISTKNTEAYEYYLKGKHIAFKQYYFIWDTAAFIRSKAMYERAIALDPEFALALAGLADLYDAAMTAAEPNVPRELDSLRQALSWKAYQLDPNSDFVNNVRIWMLNNREKPLKDSAFYHARKALQLQPNDYYNHESFAFMLRSVGLEQQSIPFLKKAVDLNPMAPEVHAFLADSYLTIGETELGDREMQIAYDLAPNQNIAAWEVMMWLISKGRLEEAEQMRNQLIAKYPRSQYRDVLCRLLIARGDREGAMKQIPFTFKARYFGLLGMKNEMLKELSKLGEGKRDFYLNLKNLSPWTSFHGDPEFQKILAAQEIRHKEYEKRYSKYMEGIVP